MITTLYCYYVPSVTGSSPNTFEEVSSMLEGLNIFYSALALIGVVIGLTLQQKELTATKEELATAAQAQKESANALKESAIAQKKHHEVYTLGLLHKIEKDRFTEAEQFTNPANKTTATHKALTLKEAYMNKLREISTVLHEDIHEKIREEKKVTIENCHTLLLRTSPSDTDSDPAFKKYLYIDDGKTQAYRKTYAIIRAAQHERGDLAKKAKEILNELHKN